jgi:hypothetical protein
MTSRFPLRQWFCIAALALSLTLGVTAPLLSARHVITVRTEFGLYLYCMVAMVMSALFFWQFRPMDVKNTWFGRAQMLLWPLLFVSVWLVFTSCVKSNTTFLKWTVRDLSPEEWAGIAADVQTLGEQSLKGKTNEERVDIWSSQALPASLRFVGRKEDFLGCSVTRVEEGKVEVRIDYGYKLRRWGVYQGPEHYLKYPNITEFVRVSTNMFFFVGGD